MAELFREFFWMVFPIGGMGIGVFAIYMAHQSKRRTIDLLKVYAQQGKEPPQALLDALERNDWNDTYLSMREPARPAEYGPFSNNPVVLWSRFVLLAFLSVGFGGMALWIRADSGPSMLTLGFFITAFVLAAVAASALVRALLTRPDGPR